LGLQHILAEATTIQMIICGLFISHVGPYGRPTLLLIPVPHSPFELNSRFLSCLSLMLLIVRV
jgi:hypothetical protein